MTDTKEGLGIPFSNKIYDGYIDESLEAKKILGLLKDCNVDTLKEELTHTGVKFTMLKEFKKCLYILIEDEGKYYHVKIHNFMREPKPAKMIGNVLAHSQARRSWVNGRLLMTLGVDTPKPLVYLENRKLGILLSSILITEYLTDANTLRNAYMLMPVHAGKMSLIIELAKFVSTLHNKKILHGDLKESNLLVKRNNSGAVSFYITDLASVKVNKGLSIEKRASDLTCLDTSFDSELPTRERLRFLYHYCRRIEGHDVDIRDLLRAVQSHSWKRLKKKAGVFK